MADRFERANVAGDATSSEGETKNKQNVVDFEIPEDLADKDMSGEVTEEEEQSQVHHHWVAF